MTRGAEPWDGPQPDDPRPDAVLFDMDGALLDIGPMWAAAAGGLVRAHGGAWRPEDDTAVRGWSVPALCARVVGRGVGLAPDEVSDALHASVAAALRRGLPWRPGAHTLLVALRRAGVPYALVTTAHGWLARDVVAKAPDADFAAVVHGDAPARPRPSPEAYEVAASRLRADPQRCAAVEDSVTGVRAALGSGALTYVVDPGTSLPDDLAAHARLRRVDGLAAVGRAVLTSPGW